MSKFKEKMYRFMYGRYGVDEFGKSKDRKGNAK